MRGKAFAIAALVAALACPVAASASAPEARAFARHHHGYKIVGVVRSDFMKGWTAVWWLKPGGPNGGYAAGGAAYYFHGREKRPKSAYFLHPFPVYDVADKGTGSFQHQEGTTQTDPENGDNVSYNNDDVNWSWDFTYHRYVFGVRAEDNVGARPKGGGTGTYTSKESSDPGPKSCTYPLAFGEEAVLDDTLSKDGTLHFTDGIGMPTQRGDACSPGNIEDPTDPNGDHPFTTDYKPERPPAEFATQDSYWAPFAIHPAFDHKKDRSHTDKDDPSFHITSFEELKIDETLTFVLTGLAAHNN